MDRTLKGANQRKYHRFKPVSATFASISFNSDLAAFKSEIVGLVFEEAYKGCGVIFLTDERLIVGAEVVIACGELPLTKAIIRWVNVLDESACKVGIEYEIKDIRK